MSYVAFNVVCCVGCFLLYFNVVTYFETLDSLLNIEIKKNLISNLNTITH